VQLVLLPTGQIKFDLARCLIAEFMGTLLFQIFGGAAPPKDTTAPAANGFSLVCIGECGTVSWWAQSPVWPCAQGRRYAAAFAGPVPLVLSQQRRVCCCGHRHVTLVVG
jgi:hypothetical protein